MNNNGFKKIVKFEIAVLKKLVFRVVAVLNWMVDNKYVIKGNFCVKLHFTNTLYCIITTKLYHVLK